MPEGSDFILALFLAGLVLVAAEVFLPGMVAGLLGAACLLGAVALVFVHHGPAAGAVATIALFLFGGIGIGLWLSYFQRTFVGRRLILSRSQPPAAEAHPDLVGREGTALTALRPAGAASIDGRRIDVTAVGEFLPEGTGIVVVAADGLRVAVRRKERLENPPPVV